MTKTISITLDTELIKYVDDLAEINGRSRSSMISFIIKKFEYLDKLEARKVGLINVDKSI